MRTFEHFNKTSNDPCPICGTKVDKETMLIAIEGTEDGNNAQAVQVHTECLQHGLWYDKELKFIYTIADK